MAYYLDNFSRNPGRELMPGRKRNNKALQIWLEDADGRRLIAFVASEDAAKAFAVKLWMARRGPSEVTIVKPGRSLERPSKKTLVASDLRTLGHVKPVAHGDERDTWHGWKPYAPPPEPVATDDQPTLKPRVRRSRRKPAAS